MRAEVELVHFEGDLPDARPTLNIVVTPESIKEYEYLSNLEEVPFTATIKKDEDGLPTLHVFDLV